MSEPQELSSVSLQDENMELKRRIQELENKSMPPARVVKTKSKLTKRRAKPKQQPGSTYSFTESIRQYFSTRIEQIDFDHEKDKAVRDPKQPPGRRLNITATHSNGTVYFESVMWQSRYWLLDRKSCIWNFTEENKSFFWHTIFYYENYATLMKQRKASAEHTATRLYIFARREERKKLTGSMWPEADEEAAWECEHLEDDDRNPKF